MRSRWAVLLISLGIFVGLAPSQGENEEYFEHFRDCLEDSERCFF